MTPQPRVCETCVSRKPRGPVKYWYRTGDFNRHLKTHLKDKYVVPVLYGQRTI